MQRLPNNDQQNVATQEPIIIIMAMSSALIGLVYLSHIRLIK